LCEATEFVDIVEESNGGEGAAAIALMREQVSQGLDGVVRPP